MKALHRILAPLALFALAAPAIALTADQAACPAGRLSADFNDQLDPTLDGTGTKEQFAMVRASIAAAVKACLADGIVAAADAQPLAGYTLGKVGSARAAELLAARGIPVTVIEQTLDIGEGRSNPSRKGLSDEDWVALTIAFRDNGFDPDLLTDSDRKLIDGYAALATLYWIGKARFAL